MLHEWYHLFYGRLSCSTIPYEIEKILEFDRKNNMLAAATIVIGVARLFGCSRATMYNLGRCFYQTGDTVDTPRSGRPKATTRDRTE